MEPTKEKAQEMADAFNERAALYENYTAKVVEREDKWQVEITSKYGLFSLGVVEKMLDVASWYEARMYIGAKGDDVYAYIY